eukprot:g5200.t1
MTGEDDAASGFSSMAAMMPDEEDEEEPIFEEDTAIGTSAGSCVDPPAEEGQCDLRRLLEEAGWPAACYNGLEHVQRCTACEEAAADKKEAAEPVQPPKRKKRRLSTSAPIRCRPPDLPESASAQEIAEAELCAQRPGCYRFLFGHYEHTVYDGGEQAYNFADESKAERAEVEYDARWVRKLALPEGTRLCFLRAAMGLGKSEAFVRLLLGIEGVNVDEFFSAQELQALSTLRRARDRVFRCLMIGPRVTFDASLHHRLELALRQAGIEIAFYQDLTKKASSQPARTGKRPCADPHKVVYQYESLHKLIGKKPFDLSKVTLPLASAVSDLLSALTLDLGRGAPSQRLQLTTLELDLAKITHYLRRILQTLPRVVAKWKPSASACSTPSRTEPSLYSTP